MKYNMTKPCDACPFLEGSRFTDLRLRELCRGEFPCHKASDIVEDSDGVEEYRQKPNGKTPHCAGALIYLEKRNRPHQMMRICERIGVYARTKLNMETKVR